MKHIRIIRNAYLDAYRTPVDANSKISEFLSSQRWKGFKPAPMPEKKVSES